MVTTLTQSLYATSNLALLVYDYLLTFETEVTAVWTCPWSIGLPLFYVNRYLPLIDVTMMVYFNRSTDNARTCEIIFKGAIWLYFISTNAAHTIIYLQTCALWGNHRGVLYLLGTLLFATFSGILVLTALQHPGMTFMGVSDTPVATAPGCRLRMASLLYGQGKYILVAIVELVTVGLMLVKGIQHVRNSSDSWVSTLYRNGIIYCLVVLVLCICNLVIPNIPAMANSANLLTPLQHTMESIMCSRVMFVILQQRRKVEIERRLGRDLTEHSKPPNSTMILTSIEESQSESVDAIELRATESWAGLSSVGVHSTGSDDRRW
ncbi:hypothetical protein DFP72DRAFT_905589 [Ephemerocybe angulata]|uniref:DUF6533 domain-containing protein n=1 Tax=Ephemerocybe angulata TaxID=980116 RepID=A0A8H6HFZ1_9AGAR|nr:hypothetical protein DFP72DRAFT_923165 [Tulosesus angulatus]KAF6752277.1 hypothetical protein DFP72DRAFT_905589 [Tulosesus angulatus]